MVYIRTKLYIKLFLIAIVTSGILGYALWRSWNFIEGPRISIGAPANGAIVNESLVRIEGLIENAAHIRLNGRPVFLNEAGELKEELLLMYGYNIIELTAEDKYGKEASKTLTLIYH